MVLVVDDRRYGEELVQQQVVVDLLFVLFGEQTEHFDWHAGTEGLDGGAEEAQTITPVYDAGGREAGAHDLEIVLNHIGVDR